MRGFSVLLLKPIPYLVLCFTIISQAGENSQTFGSSMSKILMTDSFVCLFWCISNMFLTLTGSGSCVYPATSTARYRKILCLSFLFSFLFISIVSFSIYSKEQNKRLVHVICSSTSPTLTPTTPTNSAGSTTYGSDVPISNASAAASVSISYLSLLTSAFLYRLLHT